MPDIEVEIIPPSEEPIEVSTVSDSIPMFNFIITWDDGTKQKATFYGFLENL